MRRDDMRIGQRVIVARQSSRLSTPVHLLHSRGKVVKIGRTRAVVRLDGTNGREASVPFIELDELPPVPLWILQPTDYTDHLADDGAEMTKRPYPWAAGADGYLYGRTDERRIIGFQLDPTIQRADLLWEDYVTKPPELAVGKYLIVQNETGRYATVVTAIETVQVKR